MGLVLLHLLMMAVADGSVHGNVHEENAVHLRDATLMTIVLMSFDSMPNVISD